VNVPVPLAGAFAVVFLAAAVLCTVSLWRRRGRHEGPAAAAEANHVVMAVAMAAMVLPAAATAVPPVAGAVVFAVIGAAWTARLLVLRARGRSLGSPIGGDRCAAHPTHLLLSNAAMVVMYAVMLPAAGGAPVDHAAGHGGHGGSSPLALAAVGAALAVYLLVHAAATVRVLVRSSAPVAVAAGGGGAPGPVGRLVDAPAVQLGCQAVTGAGMALMLLVH